MGEPGENRLHGTVEDINFLGSIVRIRVKVGDGEDGATPTVIALDAFNEPHLQLPDVDEAVTISFPPEACFVLGAARDGALASCGGRRGGVTVRLDGIDLVVFDKDGTIIEFGVDVERLGGRHGRGPWSRLRDGRSPGPSTRCSGSTR